LNLCGDCCVSLGRPWDSGCPTLRFRGSGFCAGFAGTEKVKDPNPSKRRPRNALAGCGKTVVFRGSELQLRHKVRDSTGL
jgi:hypothetical protein